MKIKINYDNDDLWCVYSKERIQIGAKYVIVGINELTYKLENAPVENEDQFIG